jgi:hypothetical protein
LETVRRPFSAVNSRHNWQNLQVLRLIAAMQGREGKGQPANRGRGRNGRGGRGMARMPPRTGTVAAIVSYLDLIPGKEVNPGIVTNWVNRFREYVVTVCESSKINFNIWARRDCGRLSGAGGASTS